MIPEAFLTCAMSLPAVGAVGFFPMMAVQDAPQYTASARPPTMARDDIKVIRMLMMQVTDNKRILLIGNHEEWTWLLREGGYAAWRLTMFPKFKNDIHGLFWEMPIIPVTMGMVIYLLPQPEGRKAIREGFAEVMETVQYGGFLVYDEVICPAFEKFLTPSEWFRLPFTWHMRAVYQRIERRKEPRLINFPGPFIRSLRAIFNTESHYLEWSRQHWVEILSDKIEKYDHNTNQHSQRVASTMWNFGKYLGWANGDLDDARHAAWLHDFGKVAIPESIVLKPGKLTNQEYAIMKRHVSEGEKLLRRVPAFSGVANIVADHHEHYDGSGYPYGKSGNQISRVARALSIVDTYDVITHERPYKRAKSKRWAIWELRRVSGHQFDPDLVEQFIRFLGGAPYDNAEPDPYEFDGTPNTNLRLNGSRYLMRAS